MAWFDDVKRCLGIHYSARYPADTVGFLQGSAQPAVWRQMDLQQGRGQMIVLGNRPPSQAEWVAAGVAQRGAVQEIKLSQLAGFVVIYGGFMYRPWGHIVVASTTVLSTTLPASLQSWTRNFMQPKP